MPNRELIEVHCYHASWCHSCPPVWKAFKELQKETENVFMKFIDVDVESDEGIDLSEKYQVRNIPTILIVKNENILERIVGTKSKEQIKEGHLYTKQH